MDYILLLYLILLGFISLISQSVLLREIITLFYGNELFYGLGLGGWLLFTGLGSLLATKITANQKQFKIFWIISSLQLCLLPLLTVLLRFIAAWTTLAGELPAFGFSFIMLGFTLFIFCFPLGMEFSLAASFWQKKKHKTVVNSAYFWETLGLMIGGLFFSFILSQTCFPLTTKINFLSESWQFPHLSKVVNSKYQRITVTETNNQTNYFLNGQLSFTSNEDFENQNFFNLVQPYTKNPQKILLLTNPTLANFFQKQFPNAEVRLLETDEKYLQTWEHLLNNKIDVLVFDPRKFLKNFPEKYDLIICSPGTPQTLLANRIFTKESFILFQRNLSASGVIVLSFNLPTDYQSKETTTFGNSIYQSFKTVFITNELLVKEGQILLIGGNNLSTQKNLENDFFLSQFQSSQRKKIIENWSGKKEKLNTDFEPVAFFYYQLFWQKIIGLWPLKEFFQLSFFIPLSFIILPFFTKKKIFHFGSIMMLSSFVLMGLEILIIFLFQSKIGNLFSQISLIFASFLGGISSGVKISEPIKNKKALLITSFFALSLVIIILTLLLSYRITENWTFWFLFSIIFGTFGGINFASLNTLYLKKGKNPGFVYSFDLLGSSSGALLTSTILLPLYGVKTFLYGLAILTFFSTLIIIAKPQK